MQHIPWTIRDVQVAACAPSSLPSTTLYGFDVLSGEDSIDAASALSDELCSLILVSLVLTSVSYMTLQLPLIADNQIIRTLGLTACIWAVSGCIGAVLLFVYLNLLRLHSHDRAHEFAKRTMLKITWAAMLLSPSNLVAASVISHLGALFGLVWTPSAQQSTAPDALGPIELTFLCAAIAIALAHLVFVFRQALTSARCNHSVVHHAKSMAFVDEKR